MYAIGATIRIGREIQCLPYAGFLIDYIGNKTIVKQRSVTAIGYRATFNVIQKMSLVVS